MPRRRSRWAAPTYGAAGLLFAGTAGGLAAQVRAGDDPALGAPVAAAQLPQPHYIVTRVVERRRVVIRRVRDLPPLPTRAAPVAPVAGAVAVAAPPLATSGSSSAPVRPSSAGPSPSRSAAPAAERPAAAAAPAPAPSVPAPVSRAS